jgi:putative flippase GtrA
MRDTHRATSWLLRRIPLAEYLIFARFSLVGILAGVVHILVAVILIEYGGIAVMFANLIAFLCGFSVAFSGHYHYSFRCSARYRQALVRYFTISGSGFLINNLLLLALVNSGYLGDVVSMILAAGVIPLVSFTASRLWGFQP